MNRYLAGLVAAFVVLAIAVAVHAQQAVNLTKVGGEAPVPSVCDDARKVLSVPISTSSSGNTQLVSLTASQTIYVCGYNFMAAGSVDVTMIYGTGSACATGETAITGAYNLTAQTGLAVPNAGSVQFAGAVSNAVCIKLSGAVGVRGLLTYVKQVPPS